MKRFNLIINHADKTTEKVLNKFNKEKETLQFDIQDMVIMGLFEDILGKIKTLKTLFEVNQLDAINIILRSAFEGYVYLSFILEKDTVNRAKAYAYKNKIEEIKILKSLTENNSTGKKMRKYIGRSIEEINVMYSQIITEDSYKKMQNKYKELYSSKELKKFWYDFDDKTKSFEQLCIKMDMEEKYSLIYRLFSKDVHSNRALSKVKISENEVVVGLFDNDMELQKSLSGLILIEIVRDIFTNYNLKKDLSLFNYNININY